MASFTFALISPFGSAAATRTLPTSVATVATNTSAAPAARLRAVMTER